MNNKNYSIILRDIINNWQDWKKSLLKRQINLEDFKSIKDDYSKYLDLLKQLNEINYHINNLSKLSIEQRKHQGSILKIKKK